MEDIKTYDTEYFFDYAKKIPEYPTLKGDKKVTLVMSGTANYAFAIANVLIGLQRHSPNFIDRVVIFHMGIPENDQECIKKIIDCEFIPYEPEVLLNLPQTKSIKRFSIASFAIYEIFNVLESSDYVLYLDGDVLIHRDISHILSFGPVALRLSGRRLASALGAPPPEGIDGTQRTGNTGVVLASNQIPFKGLTDLCYEKTVEYWESNALADQGILNLALALKGISISHLPRIYNCKIDDFLRPDQIITHQITTKKFWSHGLVNFFAPEWMINNSIWLSLGGSPYGGKVVYHGFLNHKDDLITQFSFIFSIFEKQLHNFLEKISSKFCSKLNIQCNIDKKRYILSIPVFSTNTSRFEIRISHSGIIIKLFSRDLHLFNTINEDLIINLCPGFSFKLTDDAGHINYLIPLNGKNEFDDALCQECVRVLHQLVLAVTPYYPGSVFEKENS